MLTLLYAALAHCKVLRTMGLVAGYQVRQVQVLSCLYKVDVHACA